MPRNLVELTLAQARCLHLAAQGLLAPPARKATPLALRRCIERMQLLQIDTIHVVARSPYLVLFSRLGDYPMAWLDDTLARGHVFEAWAHEACFVPTEQLALHRAHNHATRRHWGVDLARDADPARHAHLAELLAHIRDNGPVRAADFRRNGDDGRKGGWWAWKDEKIWLEALFARGALMVARRENFHRVYDLAERVCPAVTGLPLTPPGAVRAEFALRAVKALGLTQARWIHDYFRLTPRFKDGELEPFVESGVLRRVAVAGWDAPAYVHAEHDRLLRQAAKGRLQASHSALLSPFDPVVWDRERVARLFDFDYRIECYTPQQQRRYGYFVLPILHAGRLVGRLDAKAHRAEGVFEVKALYLQPGVECDDDVVAGITRAIHDCAVWHGTPTVRLVRTSPRTIAAPLRMALNDKREESAWA